MHPNLRPVIGFVAPEDRVADGGIVFHVEGDAAALERRIAGDRVAV
jgi:hypothetical protein